MGRTIGGVFRGVETPPFYRIIFGLNELHQKNGQWALIEPKNQPRASLFLIFLLPRAENNRIIQYAGFEVGTD
jgi:hypothetical protein